MKRAYIILLLLGLILSAQAQVSEAGPLTKNGRTYFYHSTPLTEAEMAMMCQQNCDKAYRHYMKNRKLEIAGWSLFGTGVGCVGIASGCLYGYVADHSAGILQTTSMALYGAGALISLTGIPMIITGHVRKKRTYRVYNESCGQPQTSQPELKLTTDANGIGFAVSF